MFIYLCNKFTIQLKVRFTSSYDIIVVDFKKLMIFICSFSAKVTCIFLTTKTLEKLLQILTYLQVRKPTSSFKLLMRLRFQKGIVKLHDWP